MRQRSPGGTAVSMVVMASRADSAEGYAAYSLMPADASVLTIEY